MKQRLLLIPSIHRATHQIGLHLEKLELGISQGEAHALCHLHEVGHCSVNDLHAAFKHKRSTLTGILDRLEARKLVARGIHPDDRRSFQVSLTPEGRKLAARVHEHLKTLESAVLRQVRASAQNGFSAILEAFNEVVSRGETDG